MADVWEVKHYIEETGATIGQAAAHFGMPYVTLRYRARKAGIKLPAYGRRAAPLDCEECGKTFFRSKAHINDRVFCSVACWSAASRPALVCRGCKAPFQRDPLQPNRQYCTWACFKASRHVASQCVVCDVVFDSYLSTITKREQRRSSACCSQACRNVYTSILLGGDGTWVPGGRYNPKRRRGSRWGKARRQYLNRVNFTCEGCRAEAVEVHHLVPVAMGGDLYDSDNLMAVCKACHEHMHWQIDSGSFDWELMDALHAANLHEVVQLRKRILYYRPYKNRRQATWPQVDTPGVQTSLEGFLDRLRNTV